MVVYTLLNMSDGIDGGVGVIYEPRVPTFVALKAENSFAKKTSPKKSNQ